MEHFELEQSHRSTHRQTRHEHAIISEIKVNEDMTGHVLVESPRQSHCTLMPGSGYYNVDPCVPCPRIARTPSPARELDHSQMASTRQTWKYENYLDEWYAAKADAQCPSNPLVLPSAREILSDEWQQILNSVTLQRTSPLGLQFPSDNSALNDALNHFQTRTFTGPPSNLYLDAEARHFWHVESNDCVLALVCPLADAPTELLNDHLELPTAGTASAPVMLSSLAAKCSVVHVHPTLTTTHRRKRTIRQAREGAMPYYRAEIQSTTVMGI